MFAEISNPRLRSDKVTHGLKLTCATLRETMADWLGSTVRALAFYGGVPSSSCPAIRRR